MTIDPSQVRYLSSLTRVREADGMLEAALVEIDRSPRLHCSNGFTPG